MNDVAIVCSTAVRLEILLLMLSTLHQMKIVTIKMLIMKMKTDFGKVTSCIVTDLCAFLKAAAVLG